MAGPMNPMQLMQMVKGIKNPRQFFETQLKNNPQFQTTLTQLQNSAGGAPPEQMARQMAQRAGMSESDLMEMYRTLSGK